MQEPKIETSEVDQGEPEQPEEPLEQSQLPTNPDLESRTFDNTSQNSLAMSLNAVKMRAQKLA